MTMRKKNGGLIGPPLGKFSKFAVHRLLLRRKRCCKDDFVFLEDQVVGPASRRPNALGYCFGADFAAVFEAFIRPNMDELVERT